ncbi:MAG TPA: hypothetical protein VHR18_02110 [Solirubrobacterales bacterium]|jgi:hypothetical protein|nr:hypothetical protein [Solirubrobacterales bacterium]
MRIPNPTKLLPPPHQLVDLTKRVAGLLPGVPGRASEQAAPPPAPAPPPPPPPPLKPKPKAKAAAKPKAAPKPKAATKPRSAKAKPAKAKPKPKPKPKKPGPHHALNVPVGEPDPTEWPDPYDKREDPRDPPDPDGQPFGEDPHPVTGARSTSEPHPSEDSEVEELREKYDRDKLDQ